MAKKVTKIIKLQIPAGAATAAPPVGTVLGPAGVNIGEFVNQFNSATKEKAGNIIPVVMTVFDDRSFELAYKQPPASRLILKALGKDKGSTKPQNKIGSISDAQLTELAQQKMEDMNTTDLEEAKRTLAGTAKSMGIDIK
ncbi:MAG TPA: 50S ribosomal protein L11 [Candidatus Paceibacterota bacterium]|nr:50S ribosomal protein L11 [Candidatus Paceibacterota bacterium]